ncbi:hypothetical protein GJR96_10245 [Haloferax sp. MBLA0076]|uniref:Uncharacterized protein n=1 Tax=Haloferax litoreum TaxID=2666140 RepID=A0A6A8GGN6_9EURY|nr:MULTISPECIES: hypothetical protein [Haloferax]KAB1193796.1 hypothetical protein Hfx1148_10205 [Haloferax sp. CBA1148]MRX22335.1 hypothetical protein [Haloferax litoreum]
MVQDDSFEDPIASALIDGSPYEQLRVRRRSLFKQSISQKLAWQSLILAGLTLVFPLAMTLPPSTRALFPGGDPLGSSPKILVLGAYAGTIVTIAALSLVYVGFRRLQREQSLSEREASHLLNVEEVASLISLITGVLAVVAVDGFFLLGLAGEDAIAAFLAAGGENPFGGAVIPVTVPMVAIPAGLLAAVLFALSRVFHRRLPSQ